MARRLLVLQLALLVTETASPHLRSTKTTSLPRARAASRSGARERGLSTAGSEGRRGHRTHRGNVSQRVRLHSHPHRRLRSVPSYPWQRLSLTRKHELPMSCGAFCTGRLTSPPPPDVGIWWYMCFHFCIQLTYIVRSHLELHCFPS